MARNKKNTKKGPVPYKILSDRGVHLQQVHQRQQGSNIHTGEMVVIGQDDKGKDIIATVGQRCPICNKRIRGLNHTEGAHHQGNVPRCSRR